MNYLYLRLAQQPVVGNECTLRVPLSIMKPDQECYVQPLNRAGMTDTRLLGMDIEMFFLFVGINEKRFQQEPPKKAVNYVVLLNK